jgi:hypothetical protein
MQPAQSGGWPVDEERLTREDETSRRGSRLRRYRHRALGAHDEAGRRARERQDLPGGTCRAAMRRQLRLDGIAPQETANREHEAARRYRPPGLSIQNAVGPELVQVRTLPRVEPAHAIARPASTACRIISITDDPEPPFWKPATCLKSSDDGQVGIRRRRESSFAAQRLVVGLPHPSGG